MLTVACSNDVNKYEKTDILLVIGQKRIVVYAKYANRDEKIINDFFVVYEDGYDEEDDVKLATLKDGVIRDRKGCIIMDLNNESNDFYGFKIKASYPKSKRFAPGFILDPYFDSSENVGDSQRIQWDALNETFQNNPSRIP